MAYRSASSGGAGSESENRLRSRQIRHRQFPLPDWRSSLTIMSTPTEVMGALPPVESADVAASPEQATILTLLSTYLPGYKAGGPIRSIENLVAALGKEFHFRIVTLDRDLGEKLPFPGIVANRWFRVGHADVMYLRPRCRGFRGVCALLRSVDRKTVLYVNSFFARRFSMLAVLMRCLTL